MQYFKSLIRAASITAIFMFSMGYVMSAYAANPASKEYVQALVATQGVPSGGATGEILTKRSNGNYDTYWAPSVPTMDGGTYHIDIADFINSLIEIPTSNIFVGSSTISSNYLAGTISLLDENDNNVGTFSATFLSMQNSLGITTSIENHLVTSSGLIVSWQTQAAPANLSLPTIIASLVTEVVVADTTKAGSSVFFGRSFDLVVSTDGTKITFRFGPLS